MPCNIIPTMKYEDARTAIDWLCLAFGFERHLVVEGDGTIIEHAQLTFHGGMIMLGSVRASPFDELQKPPRATNRIVTQSAYIIVSDVDAHYRQALSVGAEIVLEPEDQHYGGRAYSCRDPEGHLWNFGSYDPWV